MGSLLPVVLMGGVSWIIAMPEHKNGSAFPACRENPAPPPVLSPRMHPKLLMQLASVRLDDTTAVDSGLSCAETQDENTAPENRKIGLAEFVNRIGRRFRKSGGGFSFFHTVEKLADDRRQSSQDDLKVQ